MTLPTTQLLCSTDWHQTLLLENSTILWFLLLEPQAQIQKIAKDPSGNHPTEKHHV